MNSNKQVEKSCENTQTEVVIDHGHAAVKFVINCYYLYVYILIISVI